MRRMMTKEVTTTTVQIAKLVMVEGSPIIENLPEEKLLGNVTLEKAQKDLNKKHGQVTVMGIQADTQTYEMSVEEFLQHATLKVVAEQDEIEFAPEA